MRYGRCVEIVINVTQPWLSTCQYLGSLLASKTNGVAKGVAKNGVWRGKEKRVTPL